MEQDGEEPVRKHHPGLVTVMHTRKVYMPDHADAAHRPRDR